MTNDTSHATLDPETRELDRIRVQPGESIGDWVARVRPLGSWLAPCVRCATADDWRLAYVTNGGQPRIKAEPAHNGVMDLTDAIAAAAPPPTEAQPDECKHGTDGARSDYSVCSACCAEAEGVPAPKSWCASTEAPPVEYEYRCSPLCPRLRGDQARMPRWRSAVESPRGAPTVSRARRGLDVVGVPKRSHRAVPVWRPAAHPHIGVRARRPVQVRTRASNRHERQLEPPSRGQPTATEPARRADVPRMLVGMSPEEQAAADWYYRHHVEREVRRSCYEHGRVTACRDMSAAIAEALYVHSGRGEKTSPVYDLLCMLQRAVGDIERGTAGSENYAEIRAAAERVP